MQNQAKVSHLDSLGPPNRSKSIHKSISRIYHRDPVRFTHGSTWKNHLDPQTYRQGSRNRSTRIQTWFPKEQSPTSIKIYWDPLIDPKVSTNWSERNFHQDPQTHPQGFTRNHHLNPLGPINKSNKIHKEPQKDPHRTTNSIHQGPQRSIIQHPYPKGSKKKDQLGSTKKIHWGPQTDPPPWSTKTTKIRKDPQTDPLGSTN